jgi:hypothetical protein
MKPKLILCLALVLSGGLFGCATPKNEFGVGVGTEAQDVQLPIRFVNYRELYTFIAQHTYGGMPRNDSTLFKLASDSRTDMYTFDDPPFYVWVITPHFFNGDDEIRGAQGNGDYYVLRPLVDHNFRFANTDCIFELVGVGAGNTLKWSSYNQKVRFITSWHISAEDQPETVYEWNGKFFEQKP